MPKTKPKPETFNLGLLPLPRGRFDAARARAWLDEWATEYHWLLQTGCREREPRKLKPTDAPAHYSLADDLARMARACAAASAGTPVRFRRGDAIPNAPEAIFTILAMELTGNVDERVCMTQDACRALALEGLKHFEEWERRERERRDALVAERKQLRAELEAMTAERDRLHEYRMRLHELLLNDASNVEERLMNVLSYQNRHELALREGDHADA